MSALRSRAQALAAKGYTAVMIEAQLASEGHRADDVKAILATISVPTTLKTEESAGTRSRAAFRRMGVGLMLFGGSLLGLGLLRGGEFNIVVGLFNLGLGVAIFVKWTW